MIPRPNLKKSKDVILRAHFSYTDSPPFLGHLLLVLQTQLRCYFFLGGAVRVPLQIPMGFFLVFFGFFFVFVKHFTGGGSHILTLS